jgi:hypothetical protein
VSRQDQLSLARAIESFSGGKKMNNAVTNAATILACYDALAQEDERRLAEQQSIAFDLIMTVDCGLEFGPL